MRRVLTILGIMLFSMVSAQASISYQFDYSAYVGLHGRETVINYSRIRSSGSGVLIVADENGQQLGQTKVDGTKQHGTIRFSITEEMPQGQKIQLIFQQDGIEYPQDEALLAADDVKRDGVRKVECAEKKIAITFDSAGGLGKTEKLLDLLDKHQISCTFFLQGTFVLSHPEMTRKIYEKGHELANHSMYHPDMREENNQRIYNEITKCNSLIQEITGQSTVLYRPPSGYYSYRDRAIGRAVGSEMILWTFDSMDGFADSTEQKIWNTMTKKSEPGAIILMHVYGKHTLNILDRYIPMMKEQGYEFVTMTELMPPHGQIDSQGIMTAIDDES